MRDKLRWSNAANWADLLKYAKVRGLPEPNGPQAINELMEKRLAEAVAGTYIPGCMIQEDKTYLADQGATFCCDRCKARKTVTLPMEMAKWAKACQEWVLAHRFCAEDSATTGG